MSKKLEILENAVENAREKYEDGVMFDAGEEIVRELVDGENLSFGAAAGVLKNLAGKNPERVVNKFPVLEEFCQDDDRAAALISPREVSYRRNERREDNGGKAVVSAILDIASAIAQEARKIETRQNQGRGQGKNLNLIAIAHAGR